MPAKAKSASDGGSGMGEVAQKVIIAAVAIAVLGGLVYAIMSLTKHTGQAVDSEFKGVFGAKHTAEAVAAQNNLVLVRDAIRQVEAETGEYPASLQELVDKHMLSPNALRPVPTAPEYVYIAGQKPDMPNDNVLAYSDKPMQGVCEVLFRDGTLGSMTPEQLQQAIAKTAGTIK